MILKLLNPREGMKEARIESIAEREECYLIIQLGWMQKPEAVDGYAFPSVSAAKRYYATYYQSVRLGNKKPRWYLV